MNFVLGKALLSLLFYIDNPYFFTTFSKFLSLLFCWRTLESLYIAILASAWDFGNFHMSSVGSWNLVTLIFTKTTFCHRENTKRMAHILSNSRIRTPLKSINHASKYRIYERYLFFVLILPRYDVLPWKRCLKCRNWMVYHENMLKMT